MGARETRFDWPTRVRPYSVPGLSSCVEEARLTLDGLRLAATWIDVYALRLVEWAIAKRRSLVVIPPDPFGALAALTAAAAHVCSMTRGYQATGVARGSGLRVAVVTQDCRVRGMYRRLGVEAARLVDVVPAASRSSSGHISVLGRDVGRGWSTIFLTRPSEVELVQDLDLAVVELPSAAGDELERLDLPVIVIARDPSDPLVARLATKLPVFAWDSNDLRRLPELSLDRGTALAEGRLRLERIAEGVECAPVPIADQRISENAALFWQDIGPLLRAGNRSIFGTELAAAAFVLFYDLMHLAVPTALYERSTRPLRLRVAELARAQRLAQGDLRDLYIPMVAAELKDLVNALGAESPKTGALLSVLRERTRRREDVLLVARTAELARTYSTYLAALPELNQSVRVTSVWGVANETPADVAVFVGLMPTYARHLYTCGLASEILVLAYEADGKLDSVPGGFTECRQVQKAVAYQHEYASWLARDAAKASCWADLSGEKSGLRDDRPRPPHIDSASVAVAALPAPPDTPPGLWDGPFGTFAGLEDRVGRDAPPQLTPDGGADDEALEVDALRIGFTDLRWMLIGRDGTVTKLGKGETAEAGHSATRIEPGDHLVFLDGEARKDLLAKVLEVAGELPEFAVPAAWIDYWRNTLRRAHSRFGTYEALAAALRRCGCIRQTQTVRLWVVGQTIGPEDPEDIRRLGECVGDDALVTNYTTINSALESLRYAHQVLGHRLGALARRVGSASAAGLVGDDEIIDERTGLTASDFRDSVEILTVRTVARAGRVPYAVTGRLRSSEDTEVEIV